MRYRDAIGYLYGLEPRGISLGLGRMQKALAQRGSPERSCPAVHVAGTNGKGSVSAMLASVLRESGLRVGLYTSPHLHRLVERFRVNGRPMPTRELTRRAASLRDYLASAGAPELTFFEACTLLAFEYFRDTRCDVMVLEVGLGGRLDATNVVVPLVSVITHIALDHQDRLGSTLAAIAGEKAGVIKPGTPVIIGERAQEPLRVLRQKARRAKAPVLEIGRDFEGQAEGQTYSVRVGDTLESGLRLPLAGAYQADNLACTVAAVTALRGSGLSTSSAALRAGLRKVRWPGRLETISRVPDVLCDAAHNPDACRALAAHISTLARAYARKVLMFGVLRDKDYGQMLSILKPHFDEIVFATPASSRALAAGALAKQYDGKVFADLESCVSYAKRRAGKRGLVVAAGSIVWMSAVRAHVLQLREDPKIAL